jgi:hypothetical protein
VVCLAPRVPGESVGPRRLSGVVVRPLNFTVRHRSMALRVVGALLITLAAAFAAGAVYLGHTAVEMSSLPGRWSFPVSRELFLERSRFQGTYVIGCAGITAAAGLGMLLRKWWPLPLYGAILAAVLLATFSWLTQFFAPSDFRFDSPDPLGALMGSSVGLLAALGYAFRPRTRIDA